MQELFNDLLRADLIAHADLLQMLFHFWVKVCLELSNSDAGEFIRKKNSEIAFTLYYQKFTLSKILHVLLKEYKITILFFCNGNKEIRLAF